MSLEIKFHSFLAHLSGGFEIILRLHESGSTLDSESRGFLKGLGNFDHAFGERQLRQPSSAIMMIYFHNYNDH